MGRAVLLLDERVLRPLLRVPDDITVLGVAFDPARLCCIVHLEGEHLPECEQGAYPQPVYATYYQEADGTVRVEWHYPPRKEVGDVELDF